MALNKIAKAIDYIIAIHKKQNRIVEKELIYGDGTMFKHLSKKGFDLCYEVVNESIEQLQGIKLVKAQ